ncbi:MAG: tripartite tricarboxylate transporter permease [Lachnospiraceae bacterium]|nr:tripartite tricarboxylate transporter permease [Candidatus Equihabitans merdae]
MGLFLEGLQMVMNPETLLIMLLGTVAGLVFAVIPGLTFTTAMVLFVPLTFGLSGVSSVALILGVYAGGMSGGAFSAILLGIPGTPSAAATVYDGHKMALAGQGGKACGIAAFSSVFGGIFSLIVLMLVAPQLAKVAMQFGAPIIFSLVMLGFCCVVSLSGKNMVKGLFAGFAGLFLCTIGSDPLTGFARFTFGKPSLLSGISVMPILIGAFAIPTVVEAFVEAKERKGVTKSTLPFDPKTVKAPFPTFGEIKRIIKVLFYGSALGTALGCIPGMAGPIAPFMSYDHCKRFAPKIGEGVIEGVAAPESANNATQGGSLIPMMCLGIPCDATSAILLGALTLHGFVPGPLLFDTNKGLVYAIFISLFLIYLLALVLQFFGIRVLVRVLGVPKLNMMAVITLLAFIGSYAISLNYTYMVVMFLAGFAAYFMKRNDYPIMPLILGVVLGKNIEKNLRAALTISNGSPRIFLEEPLSLVFLGLAVIMLLFPLIKKIIVSSKAKKEAKA